MNIKFNLCCETSPVSISIQDLGDKDSTNRITIFYKERETIAFDFVSVKKGPVNSTRFDLSKKGNVTMSLTGGRGSIVINAESGEVISGGRYITVVPIEEEATA